VPLQYFLLLLPPAPPSVSTISTARSALSSLLSSWGKSTTNCDIADVSSQLLSDGQKEELLEKAKTVALFDKDAAVMSCRQDNKKVRSFILQLTKLDKEFNEVRDVVVEKDGDLDQYFELVDEYSRHMSSVNSLSYMGSQDFSSLNSQTMDMTKDLGEQALSGGRENALGRAEAELKIALKALARIVGMLEGSKDKQQRRIIFMQPSF